MHDATRPRRAIQEGAVFGVWALALGHFQSLALDDERDLVAVSERIVRIARRTKTHKKS
jgi:hypothetical protein